jgi:NAD(P)-dependent dehydrogenase (short-subunit alcohol dehydrogenase family)
MVSFIDTHSVFVASGGARGITSECVIRLAQNYPCRWILLGRSPLISPEPDWAIHCHREAELKKRIMRSLLEEGKKPTPADVQKMYKAITASREIRHTLETLNQSGSVAEYLNTDVTDLENLQTQLAAITERLGPVTGILHGAGNLADKLIEKKTQEDFETVYAAKVTGLANLLSCIPLQQLNYLVLFSSVAGFYGNAGQTDYAIANEILNKSAHLVKQKYPDCHVVAINWGPWESGMVTPELKKFFTQRQIEIIPIEVGAQLLIEELLPAHLETAQVVMGSPLFLIAREPTGPMRHYRIRKSIAQEKVISTLDAPTWISRSCEHLHPGYCLAHLENFQVLQDVNLSQSTPKEILLDLQEITRNNPNELVFEGRIWSRHNENNIQFYYSAQVALKRQILEE